MRKPFKIRLNRLFCAFRSNSSIGDEKESERMGYSIHQLIEIFGGCVCRFVLCGHLLLFGRCCARVWRNKELYCHCCSPDLHKTPHVGLHFIVWTAWLNFNANDEKKKPHGIRFAIKEKSNIVCERGMYTIYVHNGIKAKYFLFYCCYWRERISLFLQNIQ